MGRKTVSVKRPRARISGDNSLSIFHEMTMTALVQKSMAGDPQAMTAADIGRMATVEGARISEWPVGTLEPGKAADFVVLDLGDLALIPADRLESPMVYAMSDRAIRGVHVAGQPVLEGRRLARLDEERLTRRVHEGTHAFFGGQ